MKPKKNFHFLFLIGIFGIMIAALVVLVTTQTSSRVLTPSEVVETITSTADRYGSLYRVRVAGRVSEDPVNYQVEPTFRLEFRVIDRPANPADQARPTKPNNHYSNQTLAVVFEDVKPDMFTNGRDVLIDGNVIDGVLYASSLLTQCPSKYEPVEPDESA